MTSARGFASRLALAVVLALGGSAAATVSGTNTQLTQGSASSQQTSPAIAGSYVVWTNVDGSGNQDIWYEDLTVGTQQPLSASSTDQEFLEDIDGSTVVYTRSTATNPGDILVDDLTSNLGAQAVASGDGAGLHYEQPSVHGRYIVFIKVNSGQYDVAGWDNALGVPLPAITNDAALQARPRVGGDYVVFEDYSSGHSAVMAYQISAGGSPYPIALGTLVDQMPDVDGTTAVYIESTPGAYDTLWSYDFTTRTATPLSTVQSHKLLPRISGTRVVWADDRNGNWDVYTYDLTSRSEDLLIGGTGDQLAADIDGNRITYTSNFGGYPSVFVYTLSAPAPTPGVPPGCDPALTDAADAPVTVYRSTFKAANASRSFTPIAGKNYFLCVQNGNASGLQKTSQLMMVVDTTVVMTPADFTPPKSPPSWVATPILDGNHGPKPLPGTKHTWSASVYGPLLPSVVTITLRVQK